MLGYAIEPSIVAHIKQLKMRPKGSGAAEFSDSEWAKERVEVQKKTNTYTLPSNIVVAMQSARRRLLLLSK